MSSQENMFEQAPFGSYEWTVEGLRSKFIDALVLQAQNPAFTFVGVPYRDPRLPGPLALFALAPTAGDMESKTTDYFHIGVPIVHADFENPQIALGDSSETAGFVLIHHQGHNHYMSIVEPQTYDLETDSHLQALAEQVMMLQPYPVGQNDTINLDPFVA